MKRFLFVLAALLLIGVQLLSSFIVPASAAEVDNPLQNNWVSAMDFAQFLSPNGNTYYGQAAKGDLSIPIFTSQPIYQVDVVFVTNYSVSSFDVMAGSYGTALNVISLGSNMYRAYGSAGGIGSSGRVDGQDVLTFRLGSSSPDGYITMLQVHYAFSYYLNTNIGSSVDLTAPNGKSSWTNPPYELPYYKTINYATNYLNADFAMFVEFADWRKYDFIDCQLYLNVDSISSVSAYSGDIILPIEFNYVGNDVSVGGAYFVTCRIDLRGLVKSGDVPNLVVTGKCVVSDVSYTNSFAVMNSSGYIMMNSTSPLFLYFESIKASIVFNSDRIIEALSSALGGTGQGAVIKDQTQQQAGQISDAVADFGSYEKPSSSDLNSELQFSDIIAPEALSGSTSFLTALFNVPTLMSIVTLSLMLALLATIVFGKR